MAEANNDKEVPAQHVHKTEADTRYSHDVMEQVKVTVTMDGDTAATILNALGFLDEHRFLQELLFCGHTAAKLQAVVDQMDKELDIENRVER